MDVPEDGPLLGLDVGSRRIGLAVSDPLRMSASGAGTVDRLKAGWMERVAEVAREHGVTGLILGLPRRTDGSQGPEAEAVLRMGRRLSARTKLPVTYWDERLTTRQAERALLEGGLSRARRRAVVDQTAAILILQGFLDAHRQAASFAPPPDEEESGPTGSKGKRHW
ncbi:Holliday junction resolvase RuvX [Limnochorda pilosa]|uniref:Putative pre-16S rRNA nuclease n=1 Tax=Limnochorda pilosa TaxID=1555112 RepID=A0A0K2SMV6_LIMPI|nr:Holliday junction resolvase RuvX [Limnochorda pilosa]BAS28446.1 Holliday junction resolvase [Limnochorda pilosa]